MLFIESFEKRSVVVSLCYYPVRKESIRHHDVTSAVIYVMDLNPWCVLVACRITAFRKLGVWNERCKWEKTRVLYIWWLASSSTSGLVVPGGPRVPAEMPLLDCTTRPNFLSSLNLSSVSLVRWPRWPRLDLYLRTLTTRESDLNPTLWSRLH